MDGEAAALGAVLIGGAYSVWRLLQGQKAAALAINAAWAEAAHRLHGTAEGISSQFGRRVLRASVDGKVLLIEAATRTNSRGGGPSYVKLRAGPLLNLAELELNVMKRGILGKIAQKMHLSEVETDDATFHEEIRVTGHPAPLALAFLDRMTREHIKNLGEPFTLADREFVIEREEYPETGEALETMARYADIMVSRWNVLERAPKRLATELGFVLAADRVVLRPGETTTVATGVRRGHEITLSIRLDDNLTTRLTFAGGEIILPGIECNAEAASKELDALIEAAPRRAGYR